MTHRTTQVVRAMVLVLVSILGASLAFAQEDTNKGKPTAKGQMKEGAKEMGKAGKSLGHNVKHGRIARGGKRFGKHMGHSGKHIGRGTKAAVKKAVKP
jgi:hypothetical protein